MNKLKVYLLCSSLASALLASEVKEVADEHSIRKDIEPTMQMQEKEMKSVTTVEDMFTEGKVSGELRSMYAAYDKKASSETDIYATAVGGELKYETASLYGFSAGAAFITSQDLSFATGDKNKSRQNDELSSSSGAYTELSEAYLNYEYDGLNLRAGRQVIDTPLADSDDIRMIKNTFEAYVATYEISNFNFTAGYLNNWQGVDAGLDNKWSNETGQDGTWFGGAAFASDFVDASGWYYNITKSTNAAYVDLDLHYSFSDDTLLHTAFQYLNERELNNSNTEADIFGALAELETNGLVLNVAYNKANKLAGKSSFSGFGGGTLYTNMDTMILDEIAQDREATALVGALNYSIADVSIVYAYGNFNGDKDSGGTKAHIVEQDMGIEYSLNDNFSASVYYIISSDEESTAKTSYDWERTQVALVYSF